MSSRRFLCTPGGAILRGRRRIRVLLVGLTLLMAAVAVGTWIGGRFWPGLLALAVAAIPLFAWRMSSDLDALWLEVDDGWLTVQMRQRRERFSLSGAEVRRLGSAEVEHLGRLATAGGVTAGSGGFESHLLGELELYASDLDHSVLVELGEDRLVVTPDDPEGFLAVFGEPSDARVPGSWRG